MQKPYIAKDTNRPLYAFGHPVAEDGGLIRQYAALSEPRLMDYSDFKLLCEIGYAGCVERQYHGVLDRVDRTREKAINDWNASADEYNQWDSCDALEHMRHMLKVAGVQIIYEDQLPDGFDCDAWYNKSCVWCGVRVGPAI